MSTATLTRPAVEAACPPWCVDCWRDPVADKGSAFHHSAPLHDDGGIVVLVERYDDTAEPGEVNVFASLPSNLTPTQARAAAEALVRAADVAEGR